MDPNEALRKLREWANDSWRHAQYDRDVEAVETFEALDGWLSKTGFLPDDWRGSRD